MSLFGSFFAKPRGDSAVLINVGSGAVTGAYARYVEGELPTLLYTKNVAIEAHEGEASETAMERSLESLCALLLTNGAPALQRATGSGTADTVLVSVDAPWQTTTMRVEEIESEKPFTFTERLVSERLAQASKAPPGEVLVDESLVGTVLNGYETREPLGKRATRAEIIILVSSVVERIAESVALVLRRVYHTKNILLIAGASLRYQAVRAAFPLERDCLVLDATGPEIALALVRQGLLVAIHDTPDGKPGAAPWIIEVREGLAALAKSYPLPQVIFLLAKDGDVEQLSTTLSAANLGELWLSDNPPRVVALTATHLASFIRATSETAADLIVSLMVFYGQFAFTK